MSLVYTRIIGLLIVIVVASDYGFTQDAYTPATPRILIELPDHIPSDAVWIRYLLSGPGNSGSAIAILKPEPSLRQYVINAMFGGKPVPEPGSPRPRNPVLGTALSGGVAFTF